ncbi:hypothetical protein FisN_16Lh056 [Fistulifera solaris]|uniref:NAD/GMP synthase domain-containing protein n=1 Tax=Fistulifera solaris TaxID=1519565 RepID=A0A1Z5KIV2_FISSO|nr:hypothetical protein FisN_16Lh056 [Fistulifera solaris]|eukprot:GAX26230.1 hypothetical protein FisN_16Lh056 [Fistulifera solaris]
MLQSSSFSSPVEITTYRTTSQSYDTQQATALVDSLLEYTQSLIQNATHHHVIAYSGGVDSSLTAALVHRVAPQARAILGLSPAVPIEQRDLAVRVAAQIGIPLQFVYTHEGNDPLYIQNAGQACFACKTHLYSTLKAVYASVDDAVQLYNGTNADDTKDPTRVGLLAAQHFRVQSPLLFVDKQQVRLAARHMGLLNWNFAASPCLRSRLALGVPATRDHLKRIEQAERFVRQQLGVDETCNVRVRLLAQNRVCIEVDEGELLEYAHKNVIKWKPYLEEELQFAAVQVRAFRSGSVAVVK